MSTIQIEMSAGYRQYVTLIDANEPVIISNIDYSIYPHRAIGGEYIETIRNMFPSLTFKVKE